MYVKLTPIVITRRVASCDDCMWQWGDSYNADELAKKHAIIYKHCVTVETTQVFNYDGRK